MIRRTLTSMASIGLAAVALTACGGRGYSPPPPGAARLLTTTQTAIGTLVVDGAGRTLYLFAKDRGPASTCTGSCASQWPPLTATAKPRLGPGVRTSAVTLVRRPDGTRQVVLAGHPLYRYAPDRAGDINGQAVSAFGAKWFAVTPAGTAITRPQPIPPGY
jgi:predicted lipoprotein with Yx(FWY)xxD motif